MDYVYGFRCEDTRNNVFIKEDGKLLYHTAQMGIVFDSKQNKQQFYMEHNDDISCMDTGHGADSGDLVVTG